MTLGKQRNDNSQPVVSFVYKRDGVERLSG
jgi:hypothetical protein